MGKRTTVYNAGLTDNWDSVSKENKGLVDEFVEYLVSVNKSPQTIHQYHEQLKVFFCWNERHNQNKFFVDLKKRELIKFFGYLSNDLKVSPNRVCSLRSVLSSLSNFIERIMDEDYPTFRNIVKVLEPVTKTFVRERPILTMDQIKECLVKLEEAKLKQFCVELRMAGPCRL